MIGVERRQVVAVAAAEARILLEQALLQVEAEMRRLQVLIGGVGVGERELVDLAVAVQHVEQRLAAIAGLGVETLCRPTLVGRDPPGDLDELPRVRAPPARPHTPWTPDTG